MPKRRRGATSIGTAVRAGGNEVIAILSRQNEIAATLAPETADGLYGY